jgi:sugar phosphate permease
MKFPPALIMVVAALVYVLAVIQRMSPPVVALEIMNDLGLDPDGLSLMFASTLVCYGCMQPVAGFWADRFGPRRCLLAAALILGVSSFGFYAAKGMLLGLPSRALVGLAGGVALIPCLKLAANWFTPRQFGFISSCMVGSAAAANFIVGRPMAMAVEAFGWRWCFVALGFAGLALSALVFVMIQDRPAGYQPPPEEAKRSGFFESAGAILRLPEFWLLGVLYACTDMMYGVLTGLWAGPYLMEVYQLSEEAVGNILSVSAVGFLAGPPLWALLASLWKSYAKMLLCVTALNVAVAGVFVASPASLGLPALYAMCLLAPLGAQMAGMVFVLATKLVPPHLSASAMGLINIFAILPVAFMQKIIGGILARGVALEPALPAADLYSRAFTPMLVCMVISVPLALWQVRREKKVGAAF